MFSCQQILAQWKTVKFLIIWDFTNIWKPDFSLSYYVHIHHSSIGVALKTSKTNGRTKCLCFSSSLRRFFRSVGIFSTLPDKIIPCLAVRPSWNFLIFTGTLAIIWRAKYFPFTLRHDFNSTIFATGSFSPPTIADVVKFKSTIWLNLTRSETRGVNRVKEYEEGILEFFKQTSSQACWRNSEAVVFKLNCVPIFSFLISSGEHKYTWNVGRISTTTNAGINNFTNPLSGLKKYPAITVINNSPVTERILELFPNTVPRLEITSPPTAASQNRDGKTIRQRKATFLYDVCESSSLEPPSLVLLVLFSPGFPPSFFTIFAREMLKC